MAPATYASSKPSTPLGIKIICVLGAIGAVFGLFASLFAFGISPLLGVLMLVISGAQLVVVFGLWNLESWAFTLALIVYGLSAVLDLLEGNVVGLLISLIVIGYLISKSHLFR